MGFDTSAYTTSLAAMVDDRVWQFKKVLDVRLGECGLRQSEALFQHIKNFPLLFEELCKQVPVHDFKNVTVSVSNAPRNIEKSYMPVFLAGQNFGKTIAAALDAEYKEFSHQEGHIMAGIYSSKADILNEPFFAFHLSGGTTELLLVDKSDVSGR
ncbi:MAG: O-sialoglycoprotein endopeptidase, partial [Oscillospiraceae bacterium]